MFFTSRLDACLTDSWFLRLTIFLFRRPKESYVIELEDEH